MIKNGLLSLFFPSACASCGRYIKDFRFLYVCPDCYAGIRKLDGALCGTCMKPLSGAGMTECAECAEGKRHFTRIYAAGVYSGALKELIHLAKFYDRKRTAKLLADFIMENVPYEDIKWADLIVPVPLSKGSLSERGYNQTALVALELSKRTGVQCLAAVKKTRETEPQNKLERKDRLKNLKGAFEAVIPVNAKKVLVVDDVYTTGATMNEMAKTLIASGAAEVRGIVAARSV